MKKTIIYYLIAFALLFSIDAFSTTPSTKTFTVKEFNSLLVQDAIEVVLIKNNDNKIVVETDKEYQENVVLQLNNQKLSLKIKEGANNSSLKKIFKGTPKVKIYVYYKQISEIFLSGASNLTTKETIVSDKLLILLSGASNAILSTETEWLSVNCSGASKCEVVGNTDKLNLKSSGASNINAANLKSNNAEAEVSGASDVVVFAQNNLQISASGASNVKYKSLSNTKISKNITGASSVQKI